MQDCELLAGRGAIAFRGRRNDESGGGGIDKIISGGGPNSEQSPRQLITTYVYPVAARQAEIKSKLSPSLALTHYPQPMFGNNHFRHRFITDWHGKRRTKTYIDECPARETWIHSRNSQQLVKNWKFSSPNKSEHMRIGENARLPNTHRIETHGTRLRRRGAHLCYLLLLISQLCWQKDDASRNKRYEMA